MATRRRPGPGRGDRSASGSWPSYLRHPVRQILGPPRRRPRRTPCRGELLVHVGPECGGPDRASGQRLRGVERDGLDDTRHGLTVTQPPPGGGHAGFLSDAAASVAIMSGRGQARDAGQVVAGYWAAAEARDWPAFGRLLAEDVVYEVPQTRERVSGRDAYVRFNAEGFPGGWHLAVQRIVSQDRSAVSMIEFRRREPARPGCASSTSMRTAASRGSAISGQSRMSLRRPGRTWLAGTDGGGHWPAERPGPPVGHRDLPAARERVSWKRCGVLAREHALRGGRRRPSGPCASWLSRCG